MLSNKAACFLVYRGQLWLIFLAAPTFRKKLLISLKLNSRKSIRNYAMAWIESHTVLLRHRKTIMLASALDIKPVYAIGHLHALWHNALEQQEDGDLSAWPNSMFAQMSGY